MTTLDLALIGNGRIALLVDPAARIVWGCFPRLDGDATFCALLDEPGGHEPGGHEPGRRVPGDIESGGHDRDGHDSRGRDPDGHDGKGRESGGDFAIDIVDGVRTEQAYVPYTAVLVTRLFDRSGGAVEITDCVPRFHQFDRIFHPMTLVRRVRRLAGSPRVQVRLRPRCGYGQESPIVTVGSSHIRFVGPDTTLRLTTDASLTAISESRPFHLDREITLLLGPDESVPSSVAEIGRRFIEETILYWREWVRRLAIPFEWQNAVIRAAITLQQNAFDDTGAIVAAVTTSIPEAPSSGRNWDYRFCWLRDAYFVVDALNRLNATETMERYLGYIVDIATGAGERALQPVYSISGDHQLTESIQPGLRGYRGMGPVRVGNDAYRQVQHDVYGSAILAAMHVFFDERLAARGDAILFGRLEGLGHHAVAAYDQPDAGLWELRGMARVHTFSSVMCWAACDRLARIATRLALPDRAQHWRDQANRIRSFIEANCWNEKRQSYVATVGGATMDASLLLLADLGFVTGTDARFVGTLAAVEADLKRGDFVFRYAEADDFGVPENAFFACTFWYVGALSAAGRRAEARELFERLLTQRSRLGLLSEHISPATGELWGNYPQTYSMVGLITSAIRLSVPWDEAV